MGHGRFDRVMVVDVQLNYMRIASVGIDGRPQVFEPVNPATCQNHGSPRTGQGSRKLGTQTAGCAGDKGHAARKINGVSHLEYPHK